eukprot:UN05220
MKLWVLILQMINIVRGLLHKNVLAENIGSEIITGHALEYDLAANSVPEELEGMRLTRVDYAIFAVFIYK